MNSSFSTVYDRTPMIKPIKMPDGGIRGYILDERLAPLFDRWLGKKFPNLKVNDPDDAKIIYITKEISQFFEDYLDGKQGKAFAAFDKLLAENNKDLDDKDFTTRRTY